MQDRYAGDVGDFLKLGLLRTLTRDSGFRLGINWYRVYDETHNADGKHTTYLNRSNQLHAALRACDPALMTQLAAVVAQGRSIAALEASGALPPNSTTYAEHVGKHPDARPIWHQDALQRLAGCDVVFTDPDNGMRGKSAGAKTVKYALLHELADYTARGQSVVVYHHADRTAKVPIQADRRLVELHEATGIEPLGAVIARRGSSRLFLVAAAQEHRPALATAVTAYANRWTGHAEWHPFPS